MSTVCICGDLRERRSRHGPRSWWASRNDEASIPPRRTEAPTEGSVSKQRSGKKLRTIKVATFEFGEQERALFLRASPAHHRTAMHRLALTRGSRHVSVRP